MSPTSSWANEEASNYVNYYTGPAYAEAMGDRTSRDGDLAITVAIAKKEGLERCHVANDIPGPWSKSEGRLIPDQVEVEVTRNYGETAQEKVNELLFARCRDRHRDHPVWYAPGLKPAVVTIVIPVVILMTVFAAFVGLFRASIAYRCSR